MPASWVDKINWTIDGLVPVIAQEEATGTILMFAWMNKEAVKLTVETKVVVYWSRSKQRLWRKGEESGHTQKVKAIYLDCDDDVLLIQVEQMGGIACHTGKGYLLRQRKRNGTGNIYIGTRIFSASGTAAAGGQHHNSARQGAHFEEIAA